VEGVKMDDFRRKIMEQDEVISRQIRTVFQAAGDDIVSKTIRVAFDQAVEAGEITENTSYAESKEIQARYIKKNLEAAKKGHIEGEVREDFLKRVAALRAEKARLTAEPQPVEKDPLAGLQGAATNVEPDRGASVDPEKLKREYAGSEDLHKEFGTLETFLAFKQAELEGRVKIAGRKRVVKQ
jgi:hypothetical protein